MSAETRRSTRCHGQIVRPETVVEKSFMESVSGIINEVSLAGYSGGTGSGMGGAGFHHQDHHREPVVWARFEQSCDCCDVRGFSETMEANGNMPPLVVMLGYSAGVQVWAVCGNGEAHEVLSWRQGVTRDARLLPSPSSSSCYPGGDSQDLFVHKRPLLAVCDAVGSDTKFCSVSMISLRTGEQVKSIKFKCSVGGMVVSRRVLVVTFVGKLAVFDAATLEDRFTVTTCYPCPGLADNPVALGHRWLAYSDKRLNSYLQSRGGMCSESTPSYTASVLHAAKSITKGIRELGEGLACKLSAGVGGTGVSSGSGGAVRHCSPPGAGVQAVSSTGPHCGIVTVLDVMSYGTTGDEMAECAGSHDTTGYTTACSSLDDRGVVAHFQAHPAAVVSMCFDSSGSLLMTADKCGHSFHVFRVCAHPRRPSLASVHHVYTLYRGDTSAKVLDMCFSLDSRWACVATQRGTTHLFPVCPYGGAVSTRTHCGPRVVNKISTFHRSAGVQEDCCSSGRNSPVQRHRSQSGGGVSVGGSCSPLLAAPPTPSPALFVPPLAQLRQSAFSQLTASTSGGVSSRGGSGAAVTVPDDSSHVRVVSVFAAARGWFSVAGGAASGGGVVARPADALYVLSNTGTLVEYHIEPRPAGAVVAKDKVPQDAPIEVSVHALAQWCLSRQIGWSEVRPPLSSTNLLMLPAPPSSPLCRTTRDNEHSDIEHWVSQVEIVTHSGPARRLWMGPQFCFTPYPPQHNNQNIQNSTETCSDVISVNRSSPVSMPSQLNIVSPFSIECGSASSFDQCPRLIGSVESMVYGGGGTGGGTVSVSDGERAESSGGELSDRLAEAMTDLTCTATERAPLAGHVTISPASSTSSLAMTPGHHARHPLECGSGEGGSCQVAGSAVSGHSSISSSSVDVSSSPDRAASPLDFSVYEDAHLSHHTASGNKFDVSVNEADTSGNKFDGSVNLIDASVNLVDASVSRGEIDDDDGAGSSCSSTAGVCVESVSGGACCDEALIEAGWGDDIILCSRLTASTNSLTSTAATTTGSAATRTDRTTSDEEQKPTPSSRRKGKKKRK